MSKIAVAAAALALSLAAGCESVPPSKQVSDATVPEQPDAVIELQGTSLALGVGMEWATGTLSYQGRTIPIEVSGVSFARVGATNFEAKGHVYHLRRLSEFSGRYGAVSAGAGVVRGGSAMAMRNENGVVIRMASTMGGLDVDLGVKALSFEFR